MLVFGQGYEKKIQSETLKKSQFLFFSENPTFCGSNFVLWVRGGRFQNFDTRIGSYSQKRSKLLIFYEIPKAYHKIANHPVHCILIEAKLTLPSQHYLSNLKIVKKCDNYLVDIHKLRLQNFGLYLPLLPCLKALLSNIYLVTLTFHYCKHRL